MIRFLASLVLLVAPAFAASVGTVVAGGQVYVSAWDGRPYAFGLKK